jgi:hypothetical protein
MFSSRFIESDPHVVLAYERMRADSRYNIFDSWPIVKEINCFLVANGKEPSVNTWDFQEMVLRFMDNQEYYARCVQNARRATKGERKAAAGCGGAGTAAAVSVGAAAVTA